jgi:hypothetical protein
MTLSQATIVALVAPTDLSRARAFYQGALGYPTSVHLGRHSFDRRPLSAPGSGPAGT